MQATSADATRQAASGSSFYTAMRVLPPDQRKAMFDIYSFCRQVDDIADRDGPREGRIDELDGWRRDLAALYAGNPPAHLAALARTVERYGLEHADFLAVIDGMAMDVETTIVAPDLATLDLYCDRVASAVGRLSVRIFGISRSNEGNGDGSSAGDADTGKQLAYHLGRALQLTNILRDIDEDAAIGRVYLPRETLLDAGLTELTPAAIVAATLDRACAPIVAQAREHYAQSRALMAREPRRTVVAPRLMAQAYGGILDKLAARGFAPPRRPVRLSRLGLAAALLRHLLF
jgi:phytoene synthase